LIYVYRLCGGDEVAMGTGPTASPGPVPTTRVENITPSIDSSRGGPFREAEANSLPRLGPPLFDSINGY
jgi:hypothetical protein